MANQVTPTCQDRKESTNKILEASTAPHGAPKKAKSPGRTVSIAYPHGYHDIELTFVCWVVIFVGKVGYFRARSFPQYSEA